MRAYFLLTIALIILALNINASELTIPNTFEANTPAVAAQVNANFAAVEVSVDDNDSRLDALEALVTQLQTDLATANSTIGALQADLINVENNTVLQLDGYLQLAVIDGYDTAEFSGINVQVNDGSGNTTGTVNGLGNLLVGYGEDHSLALFFCSDPQYTDSLSCTDNSEVWDNNVRTGSHNLVVGYGHSYTQFGSILLSERNVSSSRGTFVAGIDNLASGLYASISGGQYNSAFGASSSIIGGQFNTATGATSIVSGGRNNTASGQNSTVSGGRNNTASDKNSSVSAGRYNTASGENSSVSGGENNTASGQFSSVSGGQNNSAIGDYSIISGGQENESNGIFSTVSGGRNNNASAGYSNVTGGQDNIASGDYSIISGGRDNEASGDSSKVNGGRYNESSGNSSSVSGGSNRTAFNSHNWVAGDLFEGQ